MTIATRSSALLTRFLAATLALSIAVFGITVVSEVVATPQAAVADGAGLKFDCVVPTFFAQYGPSSGTSTQLYKGTYNSDGSSTFTAFGPNQATTTTNYNALAFNPADNFLYGTLINGSIVRIDSTGNIVATFAANPALGTAPNALWDSGTFDNAGNYYVANGNAGTTTIYKIANLATGANLTRTTITIPNIRFADLAVKDGYLWAHDYNTNSNFYRIDFSGNVTTITSTIIPVNGYGSVFAMNNGNLAFISTAATMYQVAVTNSTSAAPTLALVGTAITTPANARSDATNCLSLPANLSITKTGPAAVLVATQVTWTITVNNAGPGLSSGFVVQDALPSGISAVTATSTNANCTIAGSNLDCTSGALAVGASVVITVKATAPNGFATLKNTAKVTGNEADTDLSNNTASVTTTVAPTAIKAVNDTASTTYPAAVTTTATPVNIGVLTNDTGTGLSVTAVSTPANGIAVITGSGVGNTVTYSPAANFSGTDSFTYTVTDQYGQVATATVTVTVPPKAYNDTIATSTNTPATINVLANDPGASETAAVATNPTHGTLSFAPNGTVTYTPASGYSGTDSFTYTQTATGGTSTATVNITVTPLAVNDSYTATVNTPVPVSVLANDKGTSITATKLTDPAHGTVTIASNGTGTYVPNAEFTGTDTFTYTLSGTGGSATATVSILVTPTAANDSATTTSTVAVSGNVLSNDHGTNRSVAVTTAPAHGSVVLDPTTGAYTYTPTGTFSGADVFTYTLTADGGTATATVSIAVKPTAVNDTITTGVNTAVSGNVTSNDNGSNKTVALGTTVTNGTLTLSATGAYTYTPNANFTGTDSFTYTLTADGGTSTATATITVTPLAVNDTYTTAAGAPAALSVLANDKGTNKSAAKLTNPSNGTVVLAADGTGTYTPNAGFSGTDSFTYTLTGDGGTAVATVTITVTPVAVADTLATPVNTAAAGNLLTNDLGTGKSVAVTSGPSHGTLTLTASTGAYTYTPTAGYSGPDSVSYTLTAAGGSSSSILTISVTPKAVDDSGTTNANTAITIPGATLVANDGGSGLTVTSVSAAVNGTIAFNGGNPSFTPATGFSGTGSYQYNATDSAGKTSSAIVTITVLPVASADTATTTANTAVTSSNLTANDAGTGLTVTAVSAPVNGTVVLGGGNPVFTPSAGFSGQASYSYTATDGSGKTTSATVTVTVLPVAAADTATTNANTAITLSTLRANDAGTGLTVTAVSSPVNGTVVVNGGSPTFTPANNFSGTASFAYTVIDGAGKNSTATVTVTVLPVAANDSVTTNANTAVTVATLTGNDAGSGLTVTGVSSPVNGTVALNGGSPIFTPANNFSGTASYGYIATDASGKTTPASVTVTVLPTTVADVVTTNANTPVTSSSLAANDAGTGLVVTAVSSPVNGTIALNSGAPIFTPTAGFSGTASYGYTVTDAAGRTASSSVTVTVVPVAVADARSTNANTPLTIANLAANDAGSSLTVTAVSAPANGTVALNGSSPVFTPTANFSGTGSFSYTATDSSNRTTTATVTVTVLPIAAADAGSTNANTPVTFSALTGNDAGTALTVTTVGGAVNGTVALNGGAPVFTPANNFSGTASFSYTATDGSGKTSSAMVTVTVLPVAAADAAATGVNVPVTSLGMTLVGNDAGTGLTVTGVGSAVNGSVTFNGGNPIFTPALGFSGTASYGYTATDSAARATSATVTVTVTPGAVNDTASTVVDVTVTIPAATLLANDSGSGLTLTAVSSPLNGTVSLNVSGNPVFVPSANFSGAASFVYTATDSSNRTSTATVAVIVVPRAVADVATTNANTPLTIAASALLANDRGTGLGITAVSNATHGTIALVSGAPVFSPANNFSGTATFDYTVTDAAGASSTTTVTVTVLPTAVSDARTTNANTPVTSSDLTGNDLGTGMAVTAVSSPVNGAVVLNGGSPIFTPATGFSGTASYSYTATDSSGKTTSATVTVTVLPVASADAATTTANTPVTSSTLTANDAGTGLTVTAVASPVNGTVVLNGGSPIFTPTTGFSGTASYSYTATDASGKTTSATVTITVLPVAAADAATTTANTAVTLSTLTGNDAGTALTVTTVGAATNGTVVLNGGSPIFTPATGFSGTASYGYTATDSSGKTSSATVTVTVLPVAVADAKTTTANTSVTLSTLTGNDAGTGLTVTAVGSATNGTVALNGGSPIFTPATGFSGTATFGYTAKDSSGQAANATVTITVLPTATGDTATTPANTPITIPGASLVANDAGTGLTVTAVGSVSNGTIALNSGNPVFTPTPGYSGTAAFSYTTTDASGAIVSATVTVSVTPTAAPDAKTTTANTAVTIPAASLTTNDVGTTLTVTAVGVPVNGSVVLNAGGNPVFTPAAGFSGAASFGYTVTDASGQVATSTVTVTVLPTAVNDAATTNANTAITLSGLTGNDAGSGLTVTAVGAATNGTVVLNAGSPIFTPSPGFSGTGSFPYTAKDGTGASTTATVTITVLPIAAGDARSTTANTAITLSNLVANDAGTGLTVTAVGTASNGSVALNAGSPIFTPTTNFSGPASFVYTATDGSGRSTSATVSITVVPVAAADAVATNANSPVSTAGSALVANDAGSGLTVTAVSSPNHGTVVLTAGKAVFTPDTNYSGPAAYLYTATDSSGGTTSATVTVTVRPIAAPDTSTTNANTPVTVSTVIANDAGTSLSVTAVSAPVNGTVVLTSGSPVFTPANNFSGTASFGYTVTDAAGQSASSTVTVTVLPVAAADTATTTANTPVTSSALAANDAGTGLTVTAVSAPVNGTVALNGGAPIFTPAAGFSGVGSYSYTATDAANRTTSATVTVTVLPVAAADSASTTANTAVTVPGSTLVGNDAGTGLTVTAVSSATNGTVSLTGGNPTFTPTAGFSGTASFVYTATDGNNRTSSATVTVTVRPGAVADSRTTNANVAVTIPDLTANDLGAGLSVTGVSTPVNGTVVLNGGSPIFTPTANFSGTASYLYTATDGSGQASSATVTITVVPVASADARTTNANAAITSSDLTANDAGTGLTVTAVGTPVNGTVALNSGSPVFTPANNFSGTASYGYTATDGNGKTSSATVTITVLPVAVSDGKTTNANTPVTFTTLTANDAGASLTVTAVSAPVNGTVALNGGSPIFTPTAGFSGAASFVYTAKDSSGQSTSATVTITVLPTATGDSGTTNANTPVTFTTLTANDAGSALTVTAVSSPVNGAVALNAGSPVFTPANNFSGTASFGYTATDTAGRTTTATVTVTVLPVTGADSATTGVNVPVTILALTLLGNDAGSSLAVTAVSSAVNGTVVLNGGSPRFTPALGFSGIASFVYTATDSAGATSSATVTVTVTPGAGNDTATTTVDVTTTLLASDLLANDSGSGLHITAVSAPVNGTVTLNASGNPVFVPTPDFSGAASFQYTAADSAGTLSTATVAVTVVPKAVADVASTNANTAVTTAASVLLANDRGTGLSITAVATGTNGTVAIVSGNPVFTPTANFSGQATYRYTITDGNGSSSSTTVTVTVLPVAVADARTTNANTALMSSDLAANDAGTDLSVTGVSTPVNGTVVLNGGSPIFTPTANFSGTASYLYTATDGSGQASSATVTITVLPVAAADARTMNANTAITSSDLTANDAGTGLTVTAVGTPANGTVALNSGSPVFTPTSNFSGTASYGYTATDGNGKTSSATVTITVLPVAVADAKTTNANTAVTVSTLTANDAGTVLTVTAVGSAVNGTVALNGGSPIFTPTANFSGTASFGYTATDAAGKTATATVTITVLPVASGDAGTTNANTPVTFSTLTGNDAGTGLTVTAVGSPVNGTVALNAGSPVFTPANNFSGTASFGYTATDTAGKTTTATALVTVLPTATADAAATGVNVPVTILGMTLVGNDAGTGLTVTAVGSPVNGTVALNGGNPIFTPVLGFSGTASFGYTATDAVGKTATATVTVTVTPGAVNDTASTVVDLTLTIPAATLLANDSGSGLTLTGVSTPENGTITLDASGNPVFIPTPNFSGIASFQYSATDSASHTTTATVTITVVPRALPDTATTTANTALTSAASALLGNDRGTGLTVTAVANGTNGTVALVSGNPVFTPAANFSGQATYGYTITDGNGSSSSTTVTVTVFPVAAGDSATTNANTAITNSTLTANDAGTGLTVTAVGSATNGTVALNGGSPIFTPATGFSGTASYSYTATDSSGKATSATVTVTVLPVAAADAASTTANTAVTSSTLTANDAGTGLTVTAVGSPVNGAVVLNGGSPIFTPATGFSGTGSYVYTATDASGKTTSATVTITVLPVATADAATTTANTAVTLSTLTGNDAGTALTVTAVGAASNGTVVLNGGSPIFTPTTGFSGTASYGYTATDSSGKTSSATVTVTVLPVAVADAKTTTANTPVTLSTLTGNDAGTGLTVTAVGSASNGTVVLNGGSPIFTPATGFSGTATFGYTAKDSSGQAVNATVTITVLPTATPDAATTPANTPVTISGASLVGNDAGTGLTVTAVGSVSNGTIALNSGNPVFTPTPGYSGTAAFSYTTTDSAGATTTATVTVIVTPGAVDDTASTTVDITVVVPATDLLANDSGTGLTVTAVGAPVNGTVSLNASGNAVFVPNANYSGAASFQYTATDSLGSTTRATVAVTVLPKATGDVATTTANTALTVAASALTTNDRGTGLTVTAVSGASHGTVFLTAGNPVFTPTSGYSGPASFGYTVTDAAGATSTATVSVSVLPTATADATATLTNTSVTTLGTDLTSNDLGTGLTVVAVANGTHGTVALNSGNPRFTPTAGYSGPASYQYTATDASGKTASATVTVTVRPVAVDDSATTGANTAVDIAATDLVGNDLGSGLQVTAVSAPTHGTVSFASGTATFVPAAGFSGSASFAYTATDSSGSTAVATVTVTVLPVAAADTATTTANTPVTSSALVGNDAGSGLTVTAVGSATNGTVVLNAGNPIFTPAAGFSGQASYAYTATDAAGKTTSATVTVTVLPVAAPDAVSTNANIPVTLATLTANDAGSVLTVTAVGSATNGTVVLNAGSPIFTPASNFSGAAGFSYTAIDASGATVSSTVAITVRPTAAADSVTTTANTAVTASGASLLGNDAGSGLTVTAVGSPSHGTVALNAGNPVFTPAAGFSGPASYLYTVTDASGATTTATVTVTVTPTATADAASTTANTAVIVAGSAITANDAGTGLTVTGVANPTNGTVALGGGSPVFTPAAGFSGTASFDYTVTDVSGSTTGSTVTVTVRPTATADSASTAANTTVTIPGATLAGNDSGSALTVTAVSGATHGTVGLNAGNAVYTPANNYSGPAAFTYTVTDASGRTATATVSITVTPSSVGDSAATGVDVPLVITGTTLTANDAGTGLTVTAVGAAVNGSVALNGGNPRFTPAAGFSGVASFQYTATDAAGATTTSMVTVVVSPGAVDDNGSTTAATPVTFPAAGLLANDSGAGLMITAVSNPVNGSVALNGGNPRFTPAAGFSGAASFDYTVTDGANSVTSATVHVSVTPTAAADSASTTAGAPVSLDAATLLANDTGAALQLTNVSSPSHGTVALLAGPAAAAQFTPAAGFSGTATFDYTATDAAGQQVTATVTVTVLPTATPDQASTPAGTPVTLTGLTANDAGTVLTVTAVSAAVGGTVTLNGGSPRFTPAAGFSGPASFVYTATDGSGNTVASTVSVTVLPVATPDTVTTRGGAPLTVTTASLIGDDLGSGLSLTAVGNPVNGTVILDVAGNPVFTPSAGFSGTASFSYTVTDATGNSSTATVTVTVLPLAVADSATTNANTAITITGATLRANDSGSSLVVTSVGSASHGAVTLNAGNPVFTPTAGFSGVASFTYTATDSSGNTTSTTVTVTVLPVAAADAASTLAGAPVTVTRASLVGNDAGSSLTVTAVQNAMGGSVVLGGGNPVFTPAPGFSGTAAFDYTVTDAAGNTASATVTVTVRPIAAGDSLAATAGTAATISGAELTGNDVGSTLTVTAVTSATHGTVALLNGVVTFTPAAGFSGNASFSYTATDASGQTVTATVAVTVRPSATPDTRATSAGIELVTVASALTANDLGSTLVITSVGNPVGGTVTLVSGVVHFVPTGGFSGTGSYDYTVRDAAGNTATTTVTITVGPVAVGDVDGTVTGIAVVVPVLANDLGTNLTVTNASPSSHGTVTIVDGGISYLPNDGYSGADVFTYVMTGDGGTSTATVRIAVSPTTAGDVGTTVADQPVDIDVLANDVGTGFEITDPGTPDHGTTSVLGGRIRYVPLTGFSGTDTFSYTAQDGAGVLRTALVTVFVSPISVPDTATGSANAPLVIDLNGNDIGWSLAVTSIGIPSNGRASIQRNGTVSFTPPAGWSGIATMEYTTTDWAGLTTANLATITIRPTAAPDAAKTPAGKAVSFALLGNDVGTGLTVTAFAKPPHGTMAITADGTATFTPDAGWWGLETLSYTTTDAAGSTATAAITITVTPSVGLAFTGSTKTHSAKIPLAYTGLAYTGADPWSMVATGLLLLMLGVMIVIVGRRNRTDP
ncbi:Ig-like domain-containing protein [Lacisediminihabitans sp. H27-G8]|uniref:Ig-like domain-containing protein n=1 Tax=Lacisediminihabitans sp. H27-G8 TaxID=3111909 RepID=UPI0038FC32BD